MVDVVLDKADDQKDKPDLMKAKLKRWKNIGYVKEFKRNKRDTINTLTDGLSPQAKKTKRL